MRAAEAARLELGNVFVFRDAGSSLLVDLRNLLTELSFGLSIAVRFGIRDAFRSSGAIGAVRFTLRTLRLDVHPDSEPAK